MPKVPKIRSFHIFTISSEEHGDEVDFLLANKHKSFLQDVSITLGLQNQACSKHPKQQVCNILQYLKKNVKNEVNFLHADKHQRFLQIDTIILSVCSEACPNYPK